MSSNVYRSCPLEAHKINLENLKTNFFYCSCLILFQFLTINTQIVSEVPGEWQGFHFRWMMSWTIKEELKSLCVTTCKKLTPVTTKGFRWQDKNNMRMFLVFLPSVTTQENSDFLAQSSQAPPFGNTLTI